MNVQITIVKAVDLYLIPFCLLKEDIRKRQIILIYSYFLLFCRNKLQEKTTY